MGRVDGVIRGRREAICQIILGVCGLKAVIVTKTSVLFKRSIHKMPGNGFLRETGLKGVWWMWIWCDSPKRRSKSSSSVSFSVEAAAPRMAPIIFAISQSVILGMEGST